MIRDNDGKFGRDFAAAATSADIDVVPIPPRSPNLNAICERFLGGLRRECLDHVLLLGEDHLRRVLAEWVGHFNGGRPHQGDRAADPEPAAAAWPRRALQAHRGLPGVGRAPPRLPKGGVGRPHPSRMNEVARTGFKPMRAIPCRVLAVLGLHDAAFPRRAQAPAWDLLAAAPRRGDRDPVREDRQLFLDALLAADDRVILTATARNIRSNKNEPLSACVDEFLRVAAATVSDRPDIRETTYRDLIEDHPLQPFNASCFTGPRASFDTGHLEIARTCQQRQAEAAPFQVGVFEPPAAVQSADLELHEMIRILKDPWSAWLGSLGIELPQSGDDPFALDREPVAAPAGLHRWQLQTEVIEAVLEGRTAFLEERLTANRLLPYGTLGTAMGRQTVQEAESLARRALQEAGGRLQPQRLVYRDGCAQVAGNIAVTPDRRLHVLVRPTELKAASHHRLDVWVRATFAAACGMRGDTVVVSKDGERTRVDRRPAMAPDQARAALDHLLHLCAHARRHPLPFGPKTSFAVFDAGQRGGNETDRAMQAWHQQPHGPPGEGDSASAQLTWRDRNPFAEETFDEWRRVAAAVFGPVEAWFATTATLSRHEADGG